MCLGDDNDDCIPTFQSGFDKASVAIYHRSIICVKRYLMAMCGRCGVLILGYVGTVPGQTGTDELLALRMALTAAKRYFPASDLTT